MEATQSMTTDNEQDYICTVQQLLVMTFLQVTHIMTFGQTIKNGILLPD